MYEANHPDASSDADLAKIQLAQKAFYDFAPRDVVYSEPVRSVVQDAPPLIADAMSDEEVARRYTLRSHEERQDRLLSFFIPDTVHNRHVVLRDKERSVPRRHGTLLRTGQGLLPDEEAMCVTCWMHGVFGAQLTLGNTSFHKLFSVSRDPYNITRASGLRILVDIGADWRLLTVPSAFEMGLSDCRWIYRLGERTITVHAVAAGEDPVIQWHITVDGKPCRFLVFGHLVLGERELDHVGRIEIDAARASEVTFRPDPNSLWGQRYPDAAYHLVVSTPDAVELIGGDELLYTDGRPRGGALRGPADPFDERASFCGRGIADGTERGETSGSQVRAPVSTARQCWRRLHAIGSASRAACVSPVATPMFPLSIRSFLGLPTTP